MTVSAQPDVWQFLPRDAEFLQQSLTGTSRTFALAIPLLEPGRRFKVGLTYLLFRVADSIEDAADADATAKIRLLSTLDTALTAHTAPGDPNAFSGLWPADTAVEQLMRATPRLLRLLQQLPPAHAAVIRRSLCGTLTGMKAFLAGSAGTDRQISIESISDLRLYCYSVAGIVGELLTDLFVLEHPCPAHIAQDLRELAVAFGEFLQLINILKDSDGDLSDGRVFIPAGANRQAVTEIALASHHDAARYLTLLETWTFPPDVLAFCRFIFLLAEGSLKCLQQHGPGSKLSRAAVQQILASVR
ncbi:MAG: squalene/phytoene synthase family protein [Planctomycetota bacterium]